jgi:hypothetical protein
MILCLVQTVSLSECCTAWKSDLGYVASELSPTSNSRPIVSLVLCTAASAYGCAVSLISRC